MSALYFRTLDRTQQACCAVSNKRDLWVERTTRTGENRKSYLSTTFLKVFYAPPLLLLCSFGIFIDVCVPR
jgi:hypothetical protein